MDRLTHVFLMCAIVVSESSICGAQGQEPPNEQGRNSRPASRQTEEPEFIVSSLLRANPLTAAYPIQVAWKDKKVVLTGKVGTTQVHDLVVRTVIDLGYPVRDDLVIDTAEAHRVALAQAAAAGTAWTGNSYGTLVGSAPYFAYPPPLFGRLDDPFFGLEPPLLSFPPWWRPATPQPRVSASPGGQTVAMSANSTSPRVPGGEFAPGRSAGPGPIKGRLQLTVDEVGQVFLSGVVASEADRKLIEEEARNTPGVSQVYSELRVASRANDPPPPPPQPYIRPEGPVRPGNPRPEATPPQLKPGPARSPTPAPEPATPSQPPTRPRAGAAVVPELAMARDSQALTRRVADSLARRSALAELPIAVQSKEGVVTLSGKVPSAYEAMLVYRTVQQTPGVKDVADRLVFQLPDENHPNPLRQKGRPEDVEAYLTSQISRHLGELAHVDRVRVRGNVVEIRGSMLRADDHGRLQAILRSIPLLRDFKLEPSFQAD
jgi:osmotically-inducible protein OsmY